MLRALQDGAAPTPGMESHLQLPSETDCGFLITSAITLPNGDFQLCVQANDQSATQSWVISDWTTQTQLVTRDQPNFCWTFSVNGIFFIEHVVEDVGTCTRIALFEDDELCPKGVVRMDVQNCDLETVIRIDDTNIVKVFDNQFDVGHNTASIDVCRVLCGAAWLLCTQGCGNDLSCEEGCQFAYQLCLVYCRSGGVPSFSPENTDATVNIANQ